MTKNDIDWPYIKVAALWFLALALASSTIWFISYHYMNEQLANLKKAQRHNNNIRMQTSIAKQDAITIRRYKTPYTSMIDSGLVGSEHRMSWISSLRAITSQLKIKSAGFQLSAQTVSKSQLINTSGLFQVRKSRMKITLALSHEGDFLRVLAALEKQPGHYSANQCTIIRQLKKIVLTPEAVNVLVRCNLDWYSFNTNSTQGAANE